MNRSRSSSAQSKSLGDSFRLRPRRQGCSLTCVDLKVEIDLGAFVELADRLGVALVAVVLGVHLVIDYGGQGGKTILAVGSNNVGLDGASASIGHVNDSVFQGIVLRVQHLAVEQPADGFLFLIGSGTGECAQNKQESAHKQNSLGHPARVIHDVAIVSWEINTRPD